MSRIQNLIFQPFLLIFGFLAQVALSPMILCQARRLGQGGTSSLQRLLSLALGKADWRPLSTVPSLCFKLFLPSGLQQNQRFEGSLPDPNLKKRPWLLAWHAPWQIWFHMIMRLESQTFCRIQNGDFGDGKTLLRTLPNTYLAKWAESSQLRFHRWWNGGAGSQHWGRYEITATKLKKCKSKF